MTEIPPPVNFRAKRRNYGLRATHVFFDMLSLLSRFLPATVAYGLARLRGDIQYRIDARKRQEVTERIEAIIGNQLSPGQIASIVRDFFRLRSCEAMDLARLNGSGTGLVKLVEIRGLQNISAAMAQGKGAMLVSAHFGSFSAALSLFGATGFPITVLQRYTDVGTLSGIELLMYRELHERPLKRHCRPIIEQRPGSFDTAVRAAKVLRANELLGSILEPPVMAADRHRAQSFDFLGKQALFLPGLVRIAQVTGSPMLMFFIRRSPDWRHQILEVAAPMYAGDDPLAAFRKMLATTEKMIIQNPAYWTFWSDRVALEEMGLLKECAT